MTGGVDTLHFSVIQRLIALKIFAAVLLIGCAQTHKPARTPNSAAVQSGISRIGTSIEAAARYNDVAVVRNARGQTLVERIHAKTEVIQKYWGK